MAAQILLAMVAENTHLLEALASHHTAMERHLALGTLLSLELALALIGYEFAWVVELRVRMDGLVAWSQKS